MARHSPLSTLHQQAGAAIGSFGPPEAPIAVVEVVDYVETEYAALRKEAVMLDQPQRGTIEVRGSERIAFLNRMVTQELKGLGPFEVRRSFWLSRKGRIDADLRLIELPDKMLIDLDAHSAIGFGERKGAAETLSEFVFSEDVTIQNQSEQWHRLALHGPAAVALLDAASVHAGGPRLTDLTPTRACVVRVGACEVIVDRDDSAGEIGLELLMNVDDAASVYDALSFMPDVQSRGDGKGYQGPDHSAGIQRARRIGWHAYNIARIEAGTPKYFIDYGPTSLPHETGVLRDRVSFKKGCYLGQEVVARMESLGHPKQRLVALKLSDSGRDVPDPQGERSGEEAVPNMPITGSAVFNTGTQSESQPSPPEPEVVGAVTSSTISPMLGGAPVCFAMVKYKHTEPGTRLQVAAGDDSVERMLGVVQPSLTLWKRP